MFLHCVPRACAFALVLLLVLAPCSSLVGVEAVADSPQVITADCSGIVKVRKIISALIAALSFLAVSALSLLFKKLNRRTVIHTQVWDVRNFQCLQTLSEGRSGFGSEITSVLSIAPTRWVTPLLNGNVELCLYLSNRFFVSLT